MKQADNLSKIGFIEHGFYDAKDSESDKKTILMNQVHSTDVLFLTEKPPELPSVDALVTQTPNLNLTVKTADCAPVLLVDQTSKMIAAVHAGWRGAFQGILETTILTMLRHSANLDTICAAIGPHIQKESFEIGAEIKALFPKTEDLFFTMKNGKIYFDFDAYVIHRLKRAGIRSIVSTGNDTYSNRQYFSYRREPKNPGRQFSSIMIKGEKHGDN